MDRRDQRQTLAPLLTAPNHAPATITKSNWMRLWVRSGSIHRVRRGIPLLLVALPPPVVRAHPTLPILRVDYYLTENVTGSSPA